MVGEVFFGEMFGFMKDSEDHGSYIASLDAVLPLIAVSAVSPSYIRPLLQLSGIAIPGVLKAVKALDGILQASFQASGKRKNDLDNGVVHRSDLLQQLFDIVREKGEKVNFSTKEVTLESYVALYVSVFVDAKTLLIMPPGSLVQILLLSPSVPLFITS